MKNDLPIFGFTPGVNPLNIKPAKQIKGTKETKTEQAIKRYDELRFSSELKRRDFMKKVNAQPQVRNTKREPETPKNTKRTDKGER